MYKKSSIVSRQSAGAIFFGFALLFGFHIPAHSSLNEEVFDTVKNSEIQPSSANAFQLTYLAYRGAYKEQGIPSYDLFCQRFLSGNLTAEEIVYAAIDQGALSAESAVDESFISDVDSQSEAICQD